ncbi:MAG TPA: serine hydrolase [Thermoanaerobaculia bacterium]
MVPFGLSGSILVADANGVVLDKGYGYADVARGIRNTPDTIYDIGSITKALTATAIAVLEDEGRLSTDDTLAKFFPDAPADKKDITLKQVLSHSAGLVDQTGDDYDPVSRQQLIDSVFAAPLVSPPGKEYHYSNSGYSILAAIVEQLSGKSYHDFMRERFFAPTGMRDTGYFVRDERRTAHTYTAPVDHGTPTARLDRAGGVYWELLGNGGMLSTTRDLYRFEQMLREGKLVSKKAQAAMFTPLFPHDNGLVLAYAWTLQDVDGEHVIHHGSDAPQLGVNGELRRYPDANLAVIFLGNTRVNGWSPRRVVGPYVRKILRGETVDVPAVRGLAANALARYAGTYALDDGSTIDVRVDGEHLVAGMNGQGAVDLFTLQKSEQSLANRRMLNAEAEKLVRAYDWSTSKYGALRDVQVLGTSRRDRGVFMTTVRADFDRGPHVLRFAWSGGKPVVESDDEALPRSGFFSESPVEHALERPLWNERERTFAFWDLYTGGTIRVEFDGDAMTVGGVRAVRSRR